MNSSKRLTSLWLALLAITSWLTGVSPSSASEGFSFYATIVNEHRGPECLAFGSNGQNPHPELMRWGGEDNTCGLGLDDLLSNRQALWRFTPLGNQEYVIENASRDPGSYACLLFMADGTAEFPERFSWGPGDACGHPGGTAGLRDSRLGIWKLISLDPAEDLYLMINSSRDPEGEYLTFDAPHRVTPYPKRAACTAEFPCSAWTQAAMNDQPQAVWKIRPVRLDSEVVPAEWSDQYILMQNVLHSNQILGADPEDDGPFGVSGSTEDNHRFRVQPSNEGDFFYLENARSGKRLHVGDDGDGELYSKYGGTSDAYKWFLDGIDSAEPEFIFRSKLYPDQRLAVETDGSGFPSAIGGSVLGTEQFRWQVSVATSPHSSVDVPYQAFDIGSEVRDYDLIFQNRHLPTLRLRVGHNGDAQLYADDGSRCDPTYHWRAEVDETSGMMWLWNQQFGDQRLHLSQPQVQRAIPTAAPGLNPVLYLWELEPAPGNWLYLRSITNHYLKLESSGQVVAQWEDRSEQSQWRLIFQRRGVCP